MRRHVIRAVLVLAAVAVPVGMAAPTWAVAGSVDIAVGADRGSAAVGQAFAIRLHIHQNGSDNVGTGQAMLEYVAPTGTELLGVGGYTTTDYQPFPYICTWLSPKAHVTCITQASWFPGSSDYGTNLVLRVVAPVTAPGRFRVSCYQSQCVDRATGNNSASIVINGVTSAGGAPKPTASKPATRPTTAASVAPSAPASASPPVPEGSSAVPTPDLSTGAGGLVQGAGAGGPVPAPAGGGLSPWVWLAAGAVLVAGTGAGLVVLRLRRAGSSGSPDQRGRPAV